jgi:hypothetical protein
MKTLAHLRYLLAENPLTLAAGVLALLFVLAMGLVSALGNTV